MPAVRPARRKTPHLDAVDRHAGEAARFHVSADGKDVAALDGLRQVDAAEDRDQQHHQHRDRVECVAEARATPWPRASAALGSRMLSALLATNAMPRTIHIVPSVMMNGCTPSPTTSPPLTAPQARPMASDDHQRQQRGGHRRHRPRRSQHHRGRHPGKRVDRSHRQIDAAGNDDDRCADGHDGEEAGVGRRLDQRVRVEEVVDGAAASVDRRANRRTRSTSHRGTGLPAPAQPAGMRAPTGGSATAPIERAVRYWPVRA